ncbi:Bacterial regulatory protein, luxR family [Pseudoalteromonas sp. P1-26]|uniref:helix-turn-helix transcriptional regulator n=1 Tax=Pseudoalteromonas sp. P1-26 TaxID=1723759 RepID=UPI0006D65A67|nr:LuxR C-terminal-related transcriptional regulator [Pseudoalteromonas sp. P1-26]KPZ67082.1 Bacterial regulatory protein, luxR family [Pseudoalteromonas sp. P1-26]
MKDKSIAVLLAIIMVLNFFDVITDISLGVPTWHIVEESLIVLASAIGFVFLVRDISNRTKRIKQLKSELDKSGIQLKNISEEMKHARIKYSEVINEQFNQWRLTKSEQEVAMLMLKGLSFREISGVRDTKEKTVRQQASSIYVKADVEGRHEFSAWFLEDFMEPDSTIE